MPSAWRGRSRRGAPDHAAGVDAVRNDPDPVGRTEARSPEEACDVLGDRDPAPRQPTDESCPRSDTARFGRTRGVPCIDETPGTRATAARVGRGHPRGPGACERCRAGSSGSRRRAWRPATGFTSGPAGKTVVSTPAARSASTNRSPPGAASTHIRTSTPDDAECRQQREEMALRAADPLRPLNVEDPHGVSSSRADAKRGPVAVPTGVKTCAAASTAMPPTAIPPIASVA